MKAQDYTTGDGPTNLVSNGIPFKPGALQNVRNFRVLDGTSEVPIAAKVLALWPQDNSIRSVLIQFNAAFSGASKDYTLEIGPPRSLADSALTPVTWDLPKRIFTLPAGYLSDSLVVWEQKPLGQSGFPAWEQKQLTNYGVIETIGTAVCPSTDHYYDAANSTYQLYARTGDLKYLVNGHRWTLHHRRDQINLSGPEVGYSKCSDNSRTRYTHVESLVEDYFFFGDEESKRVAGLVVDNFYMLHADSWYYVAPNSRGFWTEREAGFAVLGLVSYYEATNNTTYLNKARDRVQSLHRMQVDNGNRAWVHNLYDHDPSEGCPTTAYGSSPWMSGLMLEAIIKYHKLTADPIARDSVLFALDDLKARYLATAAYAGRSFIYLGCPPVYVDGLPDVDNLISHAFGYGYRLSNFTRNDYLTVGTAIFNTAVQDGYAGTHKHFNQQFRSSGHFVDYIDPGS